MGVLTDLFVNISEIEEYICSICLDVLEDPSMLEPCEHAYCKSCIEQCVTAGHNTCPLCREAIKKQKELQRPFLNLLNNLKLRCPFQVSGCESPILRLGSFADHRQACEFNPEIPRACDQDCGATLKLAERRGHNCIAYLKEIKTIAKTNSVRVNAVVQAAVAGALREFFLNRRRPFTTGVNIPDYAVFSIAVPLRNHPKGLGNCMRTGTYNHPIHIPDRVQRLEACNRMLNDRAASLEPSISFVLMQLLSRMPTGAPILALMTRGLVEVVLGMSNVAGPLNPIYFNGSPAIGMNSQSCAPGTSFFYGHALVCRETEVCLSRRFTRFLSPEEVKEIGRLFTTEFDLYKN